MITIGIDPGLSGAIGVLRDGVYVAVLDMPIVAKGSGSVKNEVDPAGLITLLRQHAPADEAISVALERVNAMPAQGSSSTFSIIIKHSTFSYIHLQASCIQLFIGFK